MRSIAGILSDLHLNLSMISGGEAVKSLQVSPSVGKKLVEELLKLKGAGPGVIEYTGHNEVNYLGMRVHWWEAEQMLAPKEDIMDML